MKSWRLIYTSVLVILTVCCKEDEECKVDTSYAPVVTPANFSGGVANPYFPLPIGKIYTYVAGNETIEITYTDDTRMIQGITAVVVHDVVSVDGSVTEDTYDWYANDNAGNVWYLGEDTKEYENGHVVSTEGSWEHGVDGAKGGIIMYAAQPAIGSQYRQEYYACHAEDKAETVSLNQNVAVTFGSFTNCLQTREFTPLEEDLNEYKYYASGVGLVLEVDVATGARMELVEVNP